MLARNTGPIDMHLRTTGPKVAIALCVAGTVVAEFVGVEAGLGYLVQTSMAFGAVVILAALGMVLSGIAEAVERRLFPWAARAPDPF